MAKLIIGCGYLGKRVAFSWLKAGETVYALTRSRVRAAELEALGMQALVGDLSDAQTLPHWPAATTVLFAVGHDRSSQVPLREVYAEGLRRTLALMRVPCERFIYVSSVGVYAQNDGSWVDENSPCWPNREGGQACLEAEQLLQNSPSGKYAIILRAGGIYGPGRIPRRADLVAGKAIPSPPHGYVNLIHVDDLVAAVLAAEKVAPPRLLAVTDGRPPLRREYYEELARLLGAPPPRFSAAEQNSPAAARAKADKRVRNTRLLAELPLQLRFPSFREGLAAIVAEENAHRGNSAAPPSSAAQALPPAVG